MLLLTATTDKLQIVTTAAATLDVHASAMDHTLSTDNVEGVRQLTAITTATTTDILAAPASGVTRNLKTLNVRNKHASLATDVTVLYNANATTYELFKCTLNFGDVLEYVEGIGWFEIVSASALNEVFVTTADYTNATTSFTDITGLSCPVLSGKTYIFDAHLYHISNATTSGAQFAVGGPTMTYVIAGTIDTVTASVTASVHSAGVVTALNTAITAQTTGSVANVLGIISGTIVPSANGTFVIRGASEVAVASGLIVRRGSFMRIREKL